MAVELLALLDPLGCLQNHGDRVETAVVQEVAKRLETKPAATDSGVAVNPAPAFSHAIVQVPDPNPAETDRPVQLFHQAIVLFRSLEGIACREKMTGVNANPQSFRLANTLE